MSDLSLFGDADLAGVRTTIRATGSDGTAASGAAAGSTARDALISPCGRYRLWLTRTWDTSKPVACWIGLNPSTADARIDDPTITRMTGFTRAWGYVGLIVVNLFALRATQPADMLAHPEPVGAGNDAAILEKAKGAGLVVACWGVHGAHQGRDAKVRQMLGDAGVPILCLGTTKGGMPRHPLYIAAATELEEMLP